MAPNRAGEQSGLIDYTAVPSYAGGSADDTARLGKRPKHRATVGVWGATAICGNDLMSSCLYTTALVVGSAGWLAPMALCGVALSLLLYRGVYAEMGGALPFNGGSYSAAMNTFSKRQASVVACFSVLSYVATCVMSAHAGASYFVTIVCAEREWVVDLVSVVLIGLVALIVFLGIRESVRVAIATFVVHMSLLCVLVVFCIVWLATGHTHQLVHFFDKPLPHDWPVAFLFGFSTGMLGVTGFETACNYIEDQQEGVYEKALWNMWWLVTVVNPVMTFMCLAIMDSDFIVEDSRHGQNDILNHMGSRSLGRMLNGSLDSHQMGEWVKRIVSADALIVLTGSTLTGFIGVKGLLVRLCSDGCLPRWLLKVNSCRGTHHRLILVFTGICLVVLAITRGDVKILAGVYSTAFLCTMTSMAVCHFAFKVRCPHVPRKVTVGRWVSVGAALSTVVALVFQAAQQAESFLISALIVFVFILMSQLTIRRQCVLKWLAGFSCLGECARRQAQRMGAKRQLVYLSNGSESVARLEAIVRTFQRNEVSRRLTFMHFPATIELQPVVDVQEVKVVEKTPELSEGIMAERLDRIRLLFSDFELAYESVALPTGFGPDAVEWVVNHSEVEVGQIAMGVPQTGFEYPLGELHGVRILNLEETY